MYSWSAYHVTGKQLKMFYGEQFLEPDRTDRDGKVAKQ